MNIESQGASLSPVLDLSSVSVQIDHDVVDFCRFDWLSPAT